MTSVLVVDGRPADRKLLATVLGHAGYAVAEAATGELAIAFARSQRPDLIITHILMPDMDGYELVNKLRSEQVTADIRVIFYTATYLVEEVRGLAGACGVSQILVKPCEPEEIICAVSEALSSPQVVRVALTSEEFHREHLRVLNTKLGQKIDELHEVERQATESLMLLEARIAEAADAAIRQIERDLHDGAQQRLGGVLLRLEVVRNVFESDPKEAARLLQGTQVELEDGLRELRELSRGIRPAILRERGLEAAIRALAIRAPIEVELQVDELGELPTTVESTVYFVTAEALSNVARHSGASHAIVTLKRGPHEITVTIRDDGHGDIDERRGSGITGLRDRVEAAHGSFSASGTPGEGSVIAAQLPLEIPLQPRTCSQALQR